MSALFCALCVTFGAVQNDFKGVWGLGGWDLWYCLLYYDNIKEIFKRPKPVKPKPKKY